MFASQSGVTLKQGWWGVMVLFLLPVVHAFRPGIAGPALFRAGGGGRSIPPVSFLRRAALPRLQHRLSTLISAVPGSQRQSEEEEESWGKLPPSQEDDDVVYGDLTFIDSVEEFAGVAKAQKKASPTKVEGQAEGEVGKTEKKRRRGIPNLRFDSPRDTAFAVLMRREEGESSVFVEGLLEDALSRVALSPSDRALCKELVLGCVRYRLLLEHLAELKQKGKRKQLPAVRVLLHLGLYQLLFLDRVPEHAAVAETVDIAKRCGYKEQSGFINAVLRSYAREQEETAALLAQLRASRPHIAASHPQWLAKDWAKRYGAEGAQALMKWNNTPAKTYARVNRLRCDPELLLSYWQEEGVQYEPVVVDWAEDTDLYSIRPRVPLARLKSFTAGLFYVQDPSTLLSIDALDPQPGETILDLCAAPGGKTCLIAQRMLNIGSLTASDIDSTRLERVEENCNRLGISCTVTVPAENLPSSDQQRYDRVLVDAPCSNSGVMRRRVEVRWRISKEEISALHQTQFELLQKAAALVQEGGVLVYSTCSLEPDENSNVIRRFMKRCGEGWKLDMERQASPLTDSTDGAYVARLLRTAAA